MTEEQKSTGKSVGEGLTAQGFGNAVAALYVLHQASNDHYFQAGYEIALGYILGGVCYGVWKLFGRRIMKWGRGG